MKIQFIVSTFVTLPEDLKSNRSIKEKKIMLNNALSELDKIHELLTTAKRMHDQFEDFATVTIHSGFFENLKSETDITKRKENLQRLLQYRLRYLLKQNTSEWEFSIEDVGNKNIPDDIKSNIKMISEIYPNFVKSINKINSVFEEIEKYIEEEKNSKALAACLLIIIDQSLKVLHNADKLILNSTPILGFIHLKFKEGVKHLS